MAVRRMTYLDGLIAGIIGATIIALWFLFLDAVTRLPLYTPTVLGTGLFVGPDDLTGAEKMQVSLKLTLLYSGVHGLVFIVLGVIAAYFLASVKRNVGIGASILLLFLVLELGFVGTTFFFAAPVLDELEWSMVLLGNLLAAAGMASYLRLRNPNRSNAV